MDLDPELRTLIEDTLANGHLSDAEAAYRIGEVDNYFLFPAGRLKRGRASLQQSRTAHLGPTAIGKMFRALEEAAGVEHRPGRAFYGLRRQATNLAPEFQGDARVLNRLSGHRSSQMREKYQDPENERLWARAAGTRRDMREHLRRCATPATEWKGG